MSTTFEIQEHPKHLDIILHPDVVDADWSSIEAFGSNVIKQLRERRKPSCIVDLSKLNYMGSALVALIVRIWKEVKTSQGKMIVVCPNPVVAQVIVLAGLDKLWRVVPHINIALKELGAPIPPAPQGMLGSQTTVSQAPQNSLRYLWPILGVIIVIVVISVLIIKTLKEAS